jgi:hypothetical protein
MSGMFGKSYMTALQGSLESSSKSLGVHAPRHGPRHERSPSSFFDESFDASGSESLLNAVIFSL